MRVFNACLKVIKKHIGSLLIYLLVFMTLSIMLTFFYDKQQTDLYEGEKTNVTVINRDGASTVLDGLMTVVEKHATLVELPDDKITLQDALFYHDTDYILYIPSGFSKDVLAGKEVTLDTAVVQGSTAGLFTDRIVNQYLGTVSAFGKVLPDLSAEEIANLTEESLSLTADAETKSFTAITPLPPSYRTYYAMTCYIIMAMCIIAVSSIMMAFGNTSLRMRNLCAPIKLRSVNAQIALCSGVVCFIGWAALMITGGLIFGTTVEGMDPRILLLSLFNSFVFLVVALSLAFLSAQFIKTFNVQNAFANIVSLGLSFLGGVFVPLELLGDSVLIAARFTPTFWYTTSVNTIASLTKFDWAALQPIVINTLIQLLFAAALLSVALVISKTKRQSNENTTSNKTEMAL